MSPKTAKPGQQVPKTPAMGPYRESPTASHPKQSPSLQPAIQPVRRRGPGQIPETFRRSRSSRPLQVLQGPSLRCVVCCCGSVFCVMATATQAIFLFVLFKEFLKNKSPRRLNGKMHSAAPKQPATRCCVYRQSSKSCDLASEESSKPS